VGDHVVVIGVGNRLRGDDAAGLEVARRVREGSVPDGVVVRELEGEGVGLLDLWSGADAVVLVDTIRSGARAGAIRRLDASTEPLPATLRGSSSTHAVGVAEAIELARALGRLPARVVVYGIEGRRFDAGAPVSPDVVTALDAAADAVLAELRTFTRPRRVHPQ
jgi:hydrogenase maturation protease